MTSHARTKILLTNLIYRDCPNVPGLGPWQPSQDKLLCSCFSNLAISSEWHSSQAFLPANTRFSRLQALTEPPLETTHTAETKVASKNSAPPNSWSQFRPPTKTAAAPVVAF